MKCTLTKACAAYAKSIKDNKPIGTQYRKFNRIVNILDKLNIGNGSNLEWKRVKIAEYKEIVRNHK